MIQQVDLDSFGCPFLYLEDSRDLLMNHLKNSLLDKLITMVLLTGQRDLGSRHQSDRCSHC